MTLRSGICHGGPLGGKMLHHHEPRFYKFMRDKRVITYVMPAAGPSALPDDIKVGAYDWDGSAWRWTRKIYQEASNADPD